MIDRLSRDWPVYILLGLVTFFFIYVIIKSKQEEIKGKKDKNKDKIPRKDLK